MDDCITTTKQNTTKPCAYFLGYTVVRDNANVWRSLECAIELNVHYCLYNFWWGSAGHEVNVSYDTMLYSSEWYELKRKCNRSDNRWSLKKAKSVDEMGNTSLSLFGRMHLIKGIWFVLFNSIGFEATAYLNLKTQQTTIVKKKTKKHLGSSTCHDIQFHVIHLNA